MLKVTGIVSPGARETYSYLYSVDGVARYGGKGTGARYLSHYTSALNLAKSGVDTGGKPPSRFVDFLATRIRAGCEVAVHVESYGADHDAAFMSEHCLVLLHGIEGVDEAGTLMNVIPGGALCFPNAIWREAHSAGTKEDPVWVANAVRRLHSVAARAAHLRATRKESYREASSRAAKEQWKNPEYRAFKSLEARTMWSTKPRLMARKLKTRMSRLLTRLKRFNAVQRDMRVKAARLRVRKLLRKIQVLVRRLARRLRDFFKWLLKAPWRRAFGHPDPAVRAKLLGALTKAAMAGDEVRKKISEATKAAMDNDEVRRRNIENSVRGRALALARREAGVVYTGPSCLDTPSTLRLSGEPPARNSYGRTRSASSALG